MSIFKKLRGNEDGKLDKEKAKSGFSWGVKIAAVVAPLVVLLLIVAVLLEPPMIVEKEVPVIEQVEQEEDDTLLVQYVTFDERTQRAFVEIHLPEPAPFKLEFELWGGEGVDYKSNEFGLIHLALNEDNNVEVYQDGVFVTILPPIEIVEASP